MDIGIITCKAEGAYSGKEYEENIVVTLATLNALKESLKDLEIYIADLDGKHSEERCRISYTQLPHGKVSGNLCFFMKNDGDGCTQEISELCNKKGLDFDADQKIIKKYIDSLDLYTEIVVRVPTSRVKELQAVARAFRYEAAVRNGEIE